MDVAGAAVRHYILVYLGGAPGAWWTRALTKGFEHVEIWQDLGDGLYVAVKPSHEFMSVEFYDRFPPGAIIQRVTALRNHGKATWPLGLKTCVTVAKNLIGIRNAVVVTPKQLFDYVAKRGGVI